jgi:hypothetical protein
VVRDFAEPVVEAAGLVQVVLLLLRVQLLLQLLLIILLILLIMREVVNILRSVLVRAHRPTRFLLPVHLQLEIRY